ncbi:uroporphyrinogen-III C-methyltransferase [Rhodopirellula sp. MGV]|uniref:uroporphyrinogen-III C-methyltransferase n=1 Tax=Rhodopirellula sp. MGV TaxID=2023130 RepID=UPI000B964260|nr:uroporphyrinogen-III C-methyltransferase [Rhodopirellula sp. MGV]OYP35062.1 uroporphyrinogen-III C-methyltransferase [Rhodopirellula sp. MGV]PNY38263.1 uroporphyrinogen-III C-methyltransferase [Rhodopirellula baltica]
MNPYVYLIGAGPGDPELLTLRGAAALAQADVVLYDGLSNPSLLSHAPQAEHICVGKHGHSRIWKQTEIIDEMLRHARDGKVVARLKGGDPAVFARTAEEVDALIEANIPFEIIPGITAALAAASYAGIPITHRKYASAVALVTGHEEPGKAESAIDWNVLARFPGTLVIYMGVTTAPVWTEALIAGGMDRATPVALVRRCSLPDQRAIHCRLDEVVDRLTPASRFRPPVIAIIGKVSELAEPIEQLRKQLPLAGQTIAVTRPRHQADSMAALIRARGGTPIIAPAIEISPVDDPSVLDAAIDRLDDTDWLIFCSHNGIPPFFERLRSRSIDIRKLAHCKIAAVGRKTAESLAKFGLFADLIPHRFSSEGLLGSLQENLSSLDGQRFLIFRASRGSDELPIRLTRCGADVHEVAAYQNVDVDQPDGQFETLLGEGGIDWITVTSGATANNLHRLYGPILHRARLAALSPKTAKVLTDLGYQVAATADPYTIDSLLDAIEKTP